MEGRLISPPLDLAERIQQQRWYHTIDLGNGQVTPGWFDMRPYVRHYGLPERMDGMRVLDCGTWDGFWAFEMERRGATVVALDVDHEWEYDSPPRRRPKEFPDTYRGEGFELAKEALGSNVQRVHCNLYEASPEYLGGTFDLVFIGTVLIHLRDQLLALERLASLAHGDFIFADEYDRASQLIPWPVSRYHADREAAVVFWLPAEKTWMKMIRTAGFDDVRKHGNYTLVLDSEGGRTKIPHVVVHAKGIAVKVEATGPAPGSPVPPKPY
jgi:methyltransferase family protein